MVELCHYQIRQERQLVLVWRLKHPMLTVVRTLPLPMKLFLTLHHCLEVDLGQQLVRDFQVHMTQTIVTTPVELFSFPAIDLITAEIPYGSLEPGENTGTLDATTTILSVGNTGLNQEVEGEAMCPGFAVGSPCGNNSTSTIPDFSQEFATSSVGYSTTGLDLSSTTPQLLLLKVPKTTSTSTPSQGVTYWGIEVPIAITTAGAYTGLNTFYAVTSSGTDWGI